MLHVITYNEIDHEQWSTLVETSATGTWFQTPEAYDFFVSMPELFRPFVVAIANNPSLSEAQHSINPSLHEQVLRAVCVGYVTVEKNPIKQFFTRRAIVLGGPALADDATDEEVNALLEAVKTKTRHLQSLNSDLHETTHQSACMQAFRQPEDLSHIAVEQQDASQKHAALTKNTKNIFYCYEPIYIETRNFNDYSRWKSAFAKAGFSYQPHLNFHVHTNQPWETIEENIGKHRRKYIRLSFRDGATIEDNPTIEQVQAYYDVLIDLYRTKVKMPLPSWSFFEKLYQLDSCKYLLVMYNGQVVGGSTCVLLKKSPITNDQSPITSAGGVYEWYACGKDGVYKNIHPSSVTKYAGMKYACDNGYAVFDMMGAGKPDEEYGVRDFKAEFGGELVEHGRFLCVTKPLLYNMGVSGVKLLKKLK